MFGLRRFNKRAAAAANDAPPAAPPRLDAEELMRRLDWTVIRRLDGALQGDYRTLFRGFGLDLADLREYQPRDDVRHIDWNVTARLQTPYVREFQEDREVSAWFVLDLSGSIDFGSAGVRKRTLLTEFVAVLARLLTRYGNRVGGILYAGKTSEVLPARSGRRHVLHLLDRVGQARADGKSGQTRLAYLLEQAYSTIKRRSVVFVISDFISAPGWEPVLGMLAQRHEVIAVRLYDPLEQALPDLGLLVLEDAETGEQLFVDTHDPGFRRRFAEQAAKREEALRSALADAGVDCLELATDDRLDAALMHFTRLRKRRSQLAGGVNGPWARP
ncbi:hypothetical protein PIGHUM_02524 [Pigmentiphaga humi]|uniref:DUF58 domain-containing protein n=1 Tax=Pigmentiphaga humi TaxID=2478468 RepID=A0A3P4B312_9BURK|nr:DUF58 domain-containing protein [Pigmentiphaga humi]VCU70452.1 hypothetical protein PIGHUM_02524 [Pigmentiphaga humi]